MRGGLPAWEARMSARIGTIEVLPERDRILVEERNKAVYSAELPAELRDLNSWLDKQLYDSNYPSTPPGSRLNDSRYGPTVQFLFSQNQKSGQPFEIAVNEMARWVKSRSSRVAGSLDPAFIREFSKISKTLIGTGDPLEPFATPDGNVRLGVNDFPDEPLWTLYRQGRKAIQFDDWPSSWYRPQTISAQPRGKCDRAWYYAMAQYRENVESEARFQDHVLKKIERQKALEGKWNSTGPKPVLAAGPEPRPSSPRLGLCRWHWRIENRRQAIEELDQADRELLAKRAAFVRGGPFPEFPDQTQIVRLALPDNDYEHYFGIRWGDISPAQIRWLEGVVQWEETEFGPTVGYFYAKAAETGGGEEAAIALLKQWAEKKPPSYQEFLRQAASGPSDFGITPALEYWFEKELTWDTTNAFDSFYKTATKNDKGKRTELIVRVNDFPDERMFSLLHKGTSIGDFNDWPRAWKRSPPRRPRS